jgi:cytochrome o ubiquinol oxidase subunit III
VVKYKTEEGVSNHDDYDHHDYAQDNKLGFWIYIMSDCLLFASLFAVYMVLSRSFAGAITPSELFDLNFVFGETILLLLSSFTFGVAVLQANRKNIKLVYVWLGITGLLGVFFLCMELYEFYHFSHEGATPQISAYWSAFYTLVGTHGLHVFGGLFWMILLFIHLAKDGLNEKNMTRLFCLSLFWHFLDIVWVCVFSIVYLMGVI